MVLTVSVIMCVFFVLTVLIRRRFTTDSPLSFFLRKKYASFLLHSITFALLCAATYRWMSVSWPEPLRAHPLFLLLLITVTTWCMASRSFMVKGSLPHTYFTLNTGKLKIDVSRRFIPELSAFSEQKAFAHHFAAQIAALKSTPCDSVIFRSHLIQPGMRKRIANELRALGLTFTAEAHKTSLWECMTLNLWYGGRTRYRLMTTEKHENDFKVHRVGSKFMITFGAPLHHP